MRRLSLLALLSVWVALPVSADAESADTLLWLQGRSDVSLVTAGQPVIDRVAGQDVTVFHRTLVTLTDGSIVVGVGTTRDLSIRDAADIYYNNVLDIETE